MSLLGYSYTNGNINRTNLKYVTNVIHCEVWFVIVLSSLQRYKNKLPRLRKCNVTINKICVINIIYPVLHTLYLLYVYFSYYE
jgi:hypothetical protein